MIEERKRQHDQQTDGTQKRRPDFLDILMKQTTENGMSVEEMREQIDTFMFAG